MGADQTGFVPRSTRLVLNTPVYFRFVDGWAIGYSVNISESGMLAVFERNLDVWLTGQLWFVVGELHVSVEARICRVDGPMASFFFPNLSDNDLTLIQKLIKG
jgi:hypothetical protein